MAEKRAAVPALERGLAVLELMAETPGALSLTEIARGLSRTVSEVQRTVAGLHAFGYLVREDRGAYRLSSKLFRIASAYPPFRDLSVRAMSAMQRFADATTESVHLGVLSDDRLLLVAQVEGRGVVRVSLQVGITQDPLSTVSGRILLSGLPEPELEGLLRRRRKLKRAAQSRLLSALERIRRQGFDHDSSSRFEGVRDLGVPVSLPDGRVIAALTSSWLPLRGARAGHGLLLLPLERAAGEIAASYESVRRTQGPRAKAPRQRGASR